MAHHAQKPFARPLRHCWRPPWFTAAFALVVALQAPRLSQAGAPVPPDLTKSASYWLERGLREADACPDAKLRSEVRLFLIQAAAQIGNETLLEQAIRQSRADAAALSTGIPKAKGSVESELSWNIATAYCLAGRFDAARRIANTIKDDESRRHVLDEIEYSRLKSVVDSIVAREAAGDIKIVLAAVDKLSEDVRFKAIDRLVADLAYKDFPAAIALIEKLPPGRKQSYDPGQLIRAGLLARDAKRVTQIVRTAIDQIAKEPDDIRKSWEYDRLLGPLQLIWPTDVPLEGDVRRHLVDELTKLLKRVGDRTAKEYLVHGLLTFGEFDAVQAAIADADDDHVRGDYTEQVARAKIVRGDLAEAIELATSGALQPDRQAIVLEMVVEEQLKRGQLKAAQETMELMDPDRLAEFSLVSQVVRELLKVKDVANAGRYVGRMPDTLEQVDGYRQIAEYYARTKEPELARKTLLLALSLAQKIEDESRRFQAIRAIASSTAVLANFDEAVRITNLVGMPNYRASSLLLLARRQLEGDAKASQENAASCAQLALAALGEIRDSKEGEAANLYVQVALLYDKLGDADRSLAAIRKAIAAASQANGAFWKLGAFGAIIGALIETKQVHRIPELVEDIKPPLDRAVACSVMAMLYSPAGPNNPVRPRLPAMPTAR